jgi:hypothetical protein
MGEHGTSVDHGLALGSMGKSLLAIAIKPRYENTRMNCTLLDECFRVARRTTWVPRASGDSTSSRKGIDNSRGPAIWLRP